jgi:hypothetical protein
MSDWPHRVLGYCSGFGATYLKKLGLLVRGRLLFHGMHKVFDRFDAVGQECLATDQVIVDVGHKGFHGLKCAPSAHQVNTKYNKNYI